jgi:DNA invertase Pin-like site-specific DNA recombinase
MIIILTNIIIKINYRIVLKNILYQKMRIFLYLRQSCKSTSQTFPIKEPSVDIQKAALTSFAQSNYPQVPIEVYQEVVSARDMTKQVALQSLSKSIEPNDILIFYDVSRLSRNIQHGVELLTMLHKKNVQIFSVSEGLSYNDLSQKHIIHMTLCSAQHEVDKLAQRVKASILYRKKQGSKFGRAPYGMKADYKHNIRLFVPNEIEQNHIEYIRRLSAQYNSEEILQKLNNKQIKKRGRTWTIYAVKRLTRASAKRRKVEGL